MVLASVPSAYVTSLPRWSWSGDLQLVLDNQHTVVRRVAPKQVDGVPAHRVFGAVKLQADPERIGKHVSVVQQSGRERVGFMRPDQSRSDTRHAREGRC